MSVSVSVDVGVDLGVNVDVVNVNVVNVDVVNDQENDQVNVKGFGVHATGPVNVPVNVASTSTWSSTSR